MAAASIHRMRASNHRAGDVELLQGQAVAAKKVVFGAPDIAEAEINEVVQTLRSGWIGTGPRVAQFEREFGEYKRAQHAVAVNSCTAALHLSLLASGIGPGDEVITTPLTFCATVNAIIHTGAKPVLVDVDRRTMNVDTALLKRAVTKKTKAIIPVHFAGLPCDMDAISAVAREHDLKVIEDCAHAVEAEYAGQPTGTIGDFGCFSFYTTKNITTCEGGMIIARGEDEAERLRCLALHGMSRDAWQRFSNPKFRHYAVTEVGFKYNMTDLNAAIGLHQLRRVNDGWRRREEIWNIYTRAFADLPLALPAKARPQDRHGYHLYTLLVDRQRCGMNREEFIEGLDGRGVGVGIHYLCLAEHPIYQEMFGWRPEDYPNATSIGRQTLSLPLSSGLSALEIDTVVSAVRGMLGAD